VNLVIPLRDARDSATRRYTYVRSIRSPLVLWRICKAPRLTLYSLGMTARTFESKDGEGTTMILGRTIQKSQELDFPPKAYFSLQIGSEMSAFLPHLR